VGPLKDVAFGLDADLEESPHELEEGSITWSRAILAMCQFACSIAPKNRLSVRLKARKRARRTFLLGPPYPFGCGIRSSTRSSLEHVLRDAEALTTRQANAG
jgi:hypothetical protein